MLMLLILFLLATTQVYIFLSSLYQEKIIKNYQNSLAKDLKDQFIGMNIKQKFRIKIQQINIDIFLNQALWELTDCLV